MKKIKNKSKKQSKKLINLKQKLHKDNSNKKQKKYEKMLSNAKKIDSKLSYKTNKFRTVLQKKTKKAYDFIAYRFGTTTYCVSGLNLTKLLNILRKNINIINTELDDTLTFTVSGKDRRKTEKILEEYNYPYITTINSKIYDILQLIFTKTTLVFTIIVVGVIFLTTNLFVLKININHYANEVNKILLENNVKIGTRLSSIDTYNLEKIILRQLDISFCDIKIVGNTLNINITKSSNITESVPQNINDVVIATADCILSRQLIYSGTATKKQFDIIKKGDILVNNFVVMDDIQIPVFASGDIFGLMQKKESLTIKKEQIEKVYTGKEKTITNIAFNKKFKNEKPPFKNYEKVEDISLISNILPLYKRTITYKETTNQKIVYNKNLVVKKYVNDINNKLINSLPIKARYKRSFFDIRENEDSYTLICYIEYEDKVSTLSSRND